MSVKNLLRFVAVIVLPLYSSNFVLGMVQEQKCQDVRKEYDINRIFRYIKEIKEIEEGMYPENDPENLMQEWLTLRLNLEQLGFTEEFRDNDFVHYLESQGIVSEKFNSLIPEVFKLDTLLFCHEKLTEAREEKLVDEFASLLRIFNKLKSENEDKLDIKDDSFVKFLIPTVVDKNTLTFVSKDISLYDFFYKWNLFLLSSREEKTV